ncbi:MAG: sulfurtransferase TusA family protein, partial [bacterium]
EIQGFKVYAAGGMGASSRSAKLLEEFVPATDAVYYAEALKQLFSKYGNRKNKHKARLRFLMEEWGLDRFKRTLEEELTDLKNKGALALELPVMERNMPAPPESGGPETASEIWLERDVKEQKQAGYSYVTIPVPLGLINSEKLIKAAELAEKYSDGSLRVDQNQNLVIRWISRNRLAELHKELVSNDMFSAHGGILGDIVSCPGSSTCQLGICLSRNLALAITGKIEKCPELASLKGVRIRISGCPNSCGQHPIGQIGLFGAAHRQGNHLAPFYKVLAGGRTEEGKTAFGKEVAQIPARNVPRMLLEFLKEYRVFQDISSDDYYTYLNSKGNDLLRRLGEKYSRLPEYEENPAFYRDWGSEEDFSLAGRGAGECGAGVLDMIAEDLKIAKASVKAAGVAGGAEKKELYKKAAYAAFRSLLVTKGEEPHDYPDAAGLFDRHFIETDLADTGFRELKEFPAEVTPETAALVERLVLTVAGLYDKMDNNLNFTSVKEKEAESSGDSSAVLKLDLSGVKCPINYVKTRLFMEEMEVGQVVKILLDEGEPIKNVPESLRNDGQEIQEIKEQGSGFCVTVRKVD